MNTATSLIRASLLSSEELAKKFGGVPHTWRKFERGYRPQKSASYAMLRKLREYCLEEGLITKDEPLIEPDCIAIPAMFTQLTATEMQKLLAIVRTEHRADIISRYGVPSSTVGGWVAGKIPKWEKSITKIRAILADPIFATPPKIEAPAAQAPKIEAKTFDTNGLLLTVSAGQLAINEKLSRLIAIGEEHTALLTRIASSTENLSNKL